MKQRESTIKKIIKSSTMNGVLFALCTLGLLFLLTLSFLVAINIVIDTNPSLRKWEVKEYLQSDELVNHQNPMLSPNRKHLLSLSWGYDMINDNDYVTFRIINNQTKEVEYVWSEYMYITTASQVKWRDNNSIYAYRDYFSYDAEYTVTHDGQEWIESGWILVNK